MRLELSPERFEHGVRDFDIGHILFDTRAQRQVEIVKFTGYSEVDETEGTEHEMIYVHLCGVADDIGGVIEFEDLSRAVYIDRTIEPIAPDWFVDEINGELDASTESETLKEAKASERKILADIKAKAEARDVENWSDTELFAKVSGAPLKVAEAMLVSYENNLARMANSTLIAIDVTDAAAADYSFNSVATTDNLTTTATA